MDNVVVRSILLGILTGAVFYANGRWGSAHTGGVRDGLITGALLLLCMASGRLILGGLGSLQNAWSVALSWIVVGGVVITASVLGKLLGLRSRAA